jgi:hypothetical protein
LSFSTSSSVPDDTGARAHVRVDLGLARAPDAHRVEVLVLQVVDVRGDDHAPRRDLVADLRGGQVRLALGDALHLRRDDARGGRTRAA